jgi:hypothetical protein
MSEPDEEDKGPQQTFDDFLQRPRFEGSTYDPKLDKARLAGQALRVYNVMQDGVWRTLADVESMTGDPQPSVSARLRDFRKEKCGSWIVERRRVADGGLHEYRLVLPPEGEPVVSETEPVGAESTAE